MLSTAEHFGDGHFPVLVQVEGLGILIGCQCGQLPARRPKRASMQHTWHQTHRRILKLRPVEYVFPEWEAGVFSTGGFVQVEGYRWDGGWVQA